MASVSMNFRPSSRTRSGGGQPGSLFLRVIHARKVLNVTTPYRVFSEEWDRDSRKLVLPAGGNSPRMKYLLDTEDKVNRDLRRIDSIVASLEKDGEYSVTDVVRSFRHSSQSNMLSGYVKKLSFDLNDRGQERTARAYRTAVVGLVRFHKGQDIRLEHINSTLIHNFEVWMRERGRSLNTISFYMRNLRAIYNRAVREHRIPARFENPFTSVYTGVNVTRKRALTKDELRLLDRLDTSLTGGVPDPKAEPMDQGLRTALGYFLFCFHARGMSFVDMAYLKKESIKNDTITYYRRKTGQLLEVKVTKDMRYLMEYFAPLAAGTPYVFPVITDSEKSHRLQYESALRTQNARLKRLARLAGIEKAVSSHVARHSWATLAHNAQYPLSVISAGLGHSNEKTTYTYLASLERSIVDSASEFISGAIKKAV